MSKLARDSLNREHWIQAAYNVLVMEGVERVRILPLAEKLGVTRGSFYWHFRNRNELLDALIDTWQQKNTGVLLKAANSDTNFTRRVLALAACWADPQGYDPGLDAAMRNWARQDAKVAQYIREADNTRVRAFQRVFLDHGIPANEALVRARVFYFTQVGYFALALQESLYQRFEFYREYYLVFTGEVLDEQTYQHYLQHVLDNLGARKHGQ